MVPAKYLSSLKTMKFVKLMFNPSQTFFIRALLDSLLEIMLKESIFNFRFRVVIKLKMKLATLLRSFTTSAPSASAPTSILTINPFMTSFL
jgi:hypothetical protein